MKNFIVILKNCDSPILIQADKYDILNGVCTFDSGVDTVASIPIDNLIAVIDGQNTSESLFNSAS